MKDIFLRVISVSDPIQGKSGQSYVVAEFAHVESRVGGPKRKSIGGSRVATAKAVLWLPGTEFPIPGTTRTVKPANIYPAEGLEIGDEIDGCLVVVAVDPSRPYTWVAEDGATIVQHEVKVVVTATPDHMLFRAMLAEAIAAKGFTPADEELRRSTSRIPAAMKVDDDTPAHVPAVSDPFGGDED